MTGSRAREIVHRSLGALTVITLLGAAVAVSTGLSWPGTVRATDDAPARAAAIAGLAPTHRPPPRRRPARLCRPARCAEGPRKPKKKKKKKRSPNPPQSASAPVGNPGITITARPNPDGSFLVSEVITLPAALTEVEVRPAPIGDAGIGFKRLRPTGEQCGAHCGWANAGRSGRSRHRRGDPALGRTHPTGAAALPPERG